MNDTARILSFLRTLGFSFEALGNQACFIPGIAICQNMVVAYDDKRWLSPGDLLHEAGHLAVIPAPFRDQIYGDPERTLDPLASEYLSTHRWLDDNHREDPVLRGLIQCGESEAQAWSYAAASHLGIDPALVFHPGAYEGGSTGLLYGFRVNCHLGIHGLMACGMTTKRMFPKMNRWLQ